MSENALMIRWGLPPPGREHRALEVLRGLTQWLVSLQQAERITGFQHFGYNTGALHERVGFVLIEGTRAQVQTLHVALDVQEQIRRIALVTTNLQIDVVELGAAIRTRLEAWDAAVQELRK